MLPDPVFAFLQTQGCSRQVVDAGLPGLVAGWEAIVARVANGYAGDLDEYLNDMDARELLADALDVARPDQREEVEDRLAEADARMRSLLVPMDRCLYGDLVAEDEGWTADRQWWYFSRPASAGPELMAELEGAGGPEGDH